MNMIVWCILRIWDHGQKEDQYHVNEADTEDSRDQIVRVKIQDLAISVLLTCKHFMCSLHKKLFLNRFKVHNIRALSTDIISFRFYVK